MTPRARSAVVTGGASGIGLALARRLAGRGIAVVIADRDDAAARSAVLDLRADGANAHGIVCDVTDSDDVSALAERATSLVGDVDVLVNNAGVGPGGVTWEMSPAVWRWTLDVNLWGVVNGIHAFVPGMVDRDRGWVINVSSVAGLRAGAGMGAYAASKHAVVGLSQSLHLDLGLARSAVGVTVLCPGFTATRMNESGRAWDVRRYGPPPAGGLLPGHPATRERFLARMEDAADPMAVADVALNAMDAGRFWALPDRTFENEIPEALRR